MIVSEMVGNRIRHYSDSNYKIKQVETGRIYHDAVDSYPCAFTYEETDQIIETRASAEEALSIILGEENTDA